MTIRFEHVTYQPEGATEPQTVRLEIAADTPQFLTGYQVDSEGDRIQPSAEYMRKHNAVDGNVMHLIEKTLITDRRQLVQDYRTGRLVRPRPTGPQVTAINRLVLYGPDASVWGARVDVRIRLQEYGWTTDVRLPLSEYGWIGPPSEWATSTEVTAVGCRVAGHPVCGAMTARPDGTEWTCVRPALHEQRWPKHNGQEDNLNYTGHWHRTAAGNRFRFQDGATFIEPAEVTP